MIDKKEFNDFLDRKIESYAQGILNRDNRGDRSALGELDFYITLRNEFLHDESKNIYDRASLRTKGLFDAMNDTLIEIGLVKKGSHFLETIQ